MVIYNKLYVLTNRKAIKNSLTARTQGRKASQASRSLYHFFISASLR